MAYATGHLIEAAHYNALIDRFAAFFTISGGLPGVARLARGTVVTSEQWRHLVQRVGDQAWAEGRPFTAPSAPPFQTGDLIRPLTISDPGALPVMWVSAPAIAYSITNVFA
ncbi:MAG: hypothetical protein ACLGIM_20145, partial [Alphaproteobacteria bacterium]